MKNSKDATFLAIGVIITLTMLVVYLVNFHEYLLEFIGVTLVLDVLCYLCHRAINDNRGD